MKKFIHASDEFPYDRIFLRNGKDEDGNQIVIYAYFEKIDNYMYDERNDIHWEKNLITQVALSRLKDGLSQLSKDLEDEQYFEIHIQKNPTIFN